MLLELVILSLGSFPNFSLGESIFLPNIIEELPSLVDSFDLLIYI